MDLKSKFWVLSLAIITTQFAVLGYLFFLLWTQLPETARQTIWGSQGEFFGLLFLISLVILMGILFLLNEIFQSYILPLSRISEEIELISTVNAGHRINVTEGGKEIKSMVQKINKAADKLQHLQEQVHQQNQPDSELRTDRETLASLFTRMPLGVVVCNRRGKILLYNRKADELLCKRSPANGSEISLGLGRSLSAFLNQDEIALAMHDLHTQLDEDVREPVSYLQVRQDQGADVPAQMVCIQDHEHAILGYALFLHAHEDYCLLQPHGQESFFLHSTGSADFAAKSQGPGILQNGRPCTYDFQLLYRQQKSSPMDMRELSELTYTVLDLETTGLDPLGGDEIVSISAVRIFNFRIVPGETFDRLVNPNRSIGLESIRVHGITDEMVANQPGIEQVLSHFWGFAKESVLVAYCADFDLTFLQLKEQNIGLKFDNPVLDVLLLSLYVHPGQKDHSLEAIASRLGTRIYPRHTSMGDALTTAEIFLQLIALLKNKGINTLQEARTVTEQVKYVGPNKRDQVMPMS
ncbi:DNA polymerase III epsilon subunit family exonuclease [Desulfosalsimonas propionicica]|uniref:DNA polymerase III epsilon subunit family exonuclease n=1 Tax=Desulfosalsimonas propionicica TaxID=332175 RepID=A0A7W0HK36_9BACT|nr:exonuclease domain-containing protein [Desulfosalsimonas propionicica]MBA2880817.1 DNA polymerase III epsilon subunit family exonuclease [Desulfosalsimonas propionicica]